MNYIIDIRHCLLDTIRNSNYEVVGIDFTRVIRNTN